MLFFASSKLGVLVEVIEVINVVIKVRTSTSNSVVDIGIVSVAVVVAVVECHL